MVTLWSICSTAWGRRQFSSTLPLPERQQTRGQGSDPPGRHERYQAKAQSGNDLHSRHERYRARAEGGRELPERQSRAQGGPCHPGQLLRSSREVMTKNRAGEHLLLPPLLWTSFPRGACGHHERANQLAGSSETGASSPPSISHFPIALVPVQVAKLNSSLTIEKGFDKKQ